MSDKSYEQLLEEDDELYRAECEGKWVISLMVTEFGAQTPGWLTYQQWLTRVRSAIGATDRSGPDQDYVKPWALGDPPRYGYWFTDHFGFRQWRTDPWAFVWQWIEGLPSATMAFCWAAIHLVGPLHDAGFRVRDLCVTPRYEMPPAMAG